MEADDGDVESAAGVTPGNVDPLDESISAWLRRWQAAGDSDAAFDQVVVQIVEDQS
jgi:hypothetical protein